MRLTILIVLLAIVVSSAHPQGVDLIPKIQKAKYFRKTPPLRDMKKIMPGERDRSWKDNIVRNEVNTRSGKHPDNPFWFDPVRQDRMGSGTDGMPMANFEGIGNLNGILPPDTDGDVGPNHYFQMINLSFAIFDKTGNLIYGPFDNSTFWDGFIGPWTGTNDGDPIVLYDELADRWLVSQFAVDDAITGGRYYELLAVSATSDPLGAYYQYAWEFPAFNDYPKIGVWPDGYYCSFNLFGTTSTRAAAAVLQRDSMLVGSSNAVMLWYDLAGLEHWNMLPSDLDGTAPPAGSPNTFMYMIDNPGTDEIRLWNFHVDWETTSNSSFTDAGTINPSAFDSDLCSATRERCIHQPGTAAMLEALSDKLMFRLQYRNFGTHEVLLTNHTVDVGGGQAGVRWYEFRDSGSGWDIFQEGTYAPDSDHRWMGSVAMDGNGNIGLGYSVSGTTTYPSIRYTGRLSTDPPGTMSIPEETIVSGGGSQTYLDAPRWGDYSNISVDPADDETFWYTQEYMQYNSDTDWKTRIASFRIEPGLPFANFQASNNSPALNATATLTDLSAGAPASWSWSVSPGTHVYTGGTSNSSQNPQIQFTATGLYTVSLTVTNTYGSDTETRTDYLEVWDNSPLVLPWVEDFEPAGPALTYTANQGHLEGCPEWDYEKTNNGRLRLQAGYGYYHGGSHAATMDCNPSGTISVNDLTATLNLENYNTTNLHLSFWYMHHGEESNPNDKVWIRGSITDNWVEAYDLFANQGSAGVWNEVSNLDVDAILAAASPSQSVTGTFQMRFGQEDNFPSTQLTASDGYTFDDIVLEVDSPGPPVVDFIADQTITTSGMDITFTDLSTNNPTLWQWNFPGGSPSYSEDQHPVIHYGEDGYFDVTLTATNPYGSTVLSKADYLALSVTHTPLYDNFETGGTAWTLSGEFEVSSPSGLGGSTGNPDPASAYEGTSALGTDISGQGASPGDYEKSLAAGAYTAVSPVINCAGYHNIKLGFMRHLNIDASSRDLASIQVNNGSGWVQVWSNIAAVSDNDWVWVEHDISAVADDQPAVQIMFAVGPTNVNKQYSGWNIDSLVVSGLLAGVKNHISWTGTADNDWNNPANWSHGTVPDANANVFIPGFVPGSNVVNTFSSSNSEIHHLTIEPDGILSIPAGHHMTVNGDIRIQAAGK